MALDLNGKLKLPKGSKKANLNGNLGGLPTEGSVVFESKTDQITTVNLAITYELPKMIARFMEENILGKMVTNELQANIDRFKDLVEKNYSKNCSN